MKELMKKLAALGAYVYEDEVVAYPETAYYEDAYETDGIVVETDCTNSVDTWNLICDLGGKWLDDDTFKIGDVWGRFVET